MDVVAPVGQPPREPLLDRAGAAGGRGHVEGLVVDPADRAVVDDPPRVGADHAVADPARLEVREPVRVQAVQELAGVGAAHQQLAERRDVDQPGGAVDGQRLALGIAVVVGAAPVAGPLHGGAELAVARMDRRALGGLHRAAAEDPHRHRHPRRPGGRGADVAEALPGLLGHQPHRRQLAHPPLAGAHGHGRVALGELDRVIALLDRQVDVLAGDVLAQAGEALAAPGAADRRRAPRRRAPAAPLSCGADLGRSAAWTPRLAVAERVRGLAAGQLAGDGGRLVAVGAGQLAGRVHAVGQLA